MSLKQTVNTKISEACIEEYMVLRRAASRKMRMILYF
jgi:hypothetical protein